MARRIDTNRNKLSASFRAVHGKTVFEYCQHHRMATAKRLLSQHACSVTQAAEIIGYEHPGNFISAYKKYFGELPKVTLTKF